MLQKTHVTRGTRGNKDARMGTTRRTAYGKSREYTLRPDGKQPGREQDAVSRDGRRWEQRPRSGRGREGAVGNEIRSGFPFPSDPFPLRPHFPDPTITARTLARNASAPRRSWGAEGLSDIADWPSLSEVNPQRERYTAEY